MIADHQKLLKITDTTAKKLESCNLNTPWGIGAAPAAALWANHIRRLPMPIGVPCQVEGVVQHQEVQFKPRKQLIVQMKDASGGVLHLRFIHFYPSHQKQLAEGKRIRAVGEIKHGFTAMK